VLAQSVRWDRGKGVSSARVAHAVKGTSQYVGSPAERVIEGADGFVVSFDGGPRPSHPAYDELEALGATAYLIQPLVFHGGRRTFISWTTDRPGGFGAALLAELEAVRPLLELRLELSAAYLATGSLLEVYLGRQASQRVLSGAFQRGGGTTIDAALWYCDMRGFTGLGDRLSPQTLVGVLDRYFEALAGPIAEQGGEILKFVGDALLAIFPVAEAGTAAACGAALKAAEEALAKVPSVEVPEGLGPLAIGIGLHLGQVMYGNIGARDRLDFTVIGGSVNEVARVEALCKDVGAPLLITAAFKGALERPERLVPVGRFQLRGVSAAQDIFTLERLRPAEGGGAVVP
jgi:adenylate cyclase